MRQGLDENNTGFINTVTEGMGSILFNIAAILWLITAAAAIVIAAAQLVQARLTR